MTAGQCEHLWSAMRPDFTRECLWCAASESVADVALDYIRGSSLPVCTNELATAEKLTWSEADDVMRRLELDCKIVANDGNLGGYMLRERL